MNSDSLCFSDTYISTSGGAKIPIKLLKVDDKILLECDVPDMLLTHLFDDLPSRSRDTQLKMIRGVFYPNEGLFLDIFDSIGRINVNSVQISTEEANDRLFNELLWQLNEK